MLERLVRGFEIIRGFLGNLVQRYLVEETLEGDRLGDQAKIVPHFIKLILASSQQAAT